MLDNNFEIKEPLLHEVTNEQLTILQLRINQIIITVNHIVLNSLTKSRKRSNLLDINWQ